MTDPKDPWSAEQSEPRRQRAAKTEIMSRDRVDPSAATRPAREPAEGFEADQRTELLQSKEEIESRLAAVADLPTQYELETLQPEVEEATEDASEEPPPGASNPALDAPTYDEMDVPRTAPEPAPSEASPWQGQGNIDLTPQPGPSTPDKRANERTAMIPEAMRAEALNFDLKPAEPDASDKRPLIIAAVVAAVLFAAALAAASVLFGPADLSTKADPASMDPAPTGPAPDEPTPDEPAVAPTNTADAGPTPAELAEPVEQLWPDSPKPVHDVADPSWARKVVEFSVVRAKDPLVTRLRTTFLKSLKSDDHARWKFKKRPTRKGVKIELGLGDMEIQELNGELVVQAYCYAKGDAKWRTLEVTANAKVSTSAPAPPGLLDELKRDATSACARRLAVTFVPGILKDPAP